MNVKTGVVSSLKKLKHSPNNTQDYITNDALSTFNEQRYNSVAIYRPDSVSYTHLTLPTNLSV